VIDKQKRTASQVRYNKDATTPLSIKLNHRTDQDILTYLQTVDNKQGLVKELIRKRMAEEGFRYPEDST